MALFCHYSRHRSSSARLEGKSFGSCGLFFVGDDARVSTAALRGSCWGDGTFFHDFFLGFLGHSRLTYREELLEGALLRACVRHALVGVW